jgi:hypothetical protein
MGPAVRQHTTEMSSKFDDNDLQLKNMELPGTSGLDSIFFSFLGFAAGTSTSSPIMSENIFFLRWLPSCCEALSDQQIGNGQHTTRPAFA